MTHFDTTIDIPAPPDRVWTALRDIEHWSEWTPTVISVCGFSWITRSPGILVTACHWIEDAGKGRRVTLSLDFSGPLGPLCARLIRGLNARYLDIEPRGLKKRAEADAQLQAPKMGRAGGS